MMIGCIMKMVSWCQYSDGGGSFCDDDGVFVFNQANTTFQTKHPNDVMEEWKKLYKMVNSLFEEVILPKHFAKTFLRR